MKPIPDCVPDALRLVLDTARLVSDDAFIHRKVLTKVMNALTDDNDLGDSSADVMLKCLNVAYKALGVRDPYEKLKARRNKAMLGLESEFRGYLDVAPNRLVACINLALAGGAGDADGLGREDFERDILQHLDDPIGRDERERLLKDLSRAESVLYVLNAAGEIVLDKLLIEELAQRCEVTAVVARQPLLDFATRDDVEAVGLDKFAKIVDPGAPMFGLVLPRASSAFRETFEQAGLAIAKGERNYDTLAGCDREVYFLLQCVCEHAARKLRIDLGSSAVFCYEPSRPAEARSAATE